MSEMDGKCRKCKNYGSKICSRCDMYYDEFDPMDDQPQTNADRIRAMTGEELAEFCSKLGCYPSASKETCIGVSQCIACWLEWLKQEAEEC